MNLCHICSYWRSVALGTPRLWNSLYHISYASADVEDKDILRYGIRPIDIEFLRWWATNMDPHPPTLRLHIETRDVTGLQQSETDVAESNHIFVLGLIASAQCLALGCVFYNIFRGNTYQLMSPNLQSLLILDELVDVEHVFLSDVPTHPAQIYKKLYIEGLFIKDSNVGTELPWTSLTHVCIDLKINLPTWIHFKKLHNLEYGEFCLRLRDDAPPIFSDVTLPHLRQLSINLKREPVFNARIFEGLTFPALTGFRLRTNNLSIQELHEVLRIAPALAELQLDCGFPFDRNLDMIVPFPAGVDSLSSIIPNLEFLVIETSHTGSVDSSREWRANFINSSWLNLRSKQNRIKTVLFYWGRVVDYSYTPYLIDVIENNVVEVHIDGVSLRTQYDWNDLAHSGFGVEFYLENGFMDWDEQMGFYLEHTINS